VLNLTRCEREKESAGGRKGLRSNDASSRGRRTPADLSFYWDRSLGDPQMPRYLQTDEYSTREEEDSMATKKTARERDGKAKTDANGRAAKDVEIADDTRRRRGKGGLSMT